MWKAFPLVTELEILKREALKKFNVFSHLQPWQPSFQRKSVKIISGKAASLVTVLQQVFIYLEQIAIHFARLSFSIFIPLSETSSRLCEKHHQKELFLSIHSVNWSILPLKDSFITFYCSSFHSVVYLLLSIFATFKSSFCV